MTRHMTSVLTGMTLLGLAIAIPQSAFAQNNPLIGTWKQNLDKSKYNPGPLPRSNTLYWTQDGQNIRDTNQGTDAQGNPTTGVIMINFDGQPIHRPASRTGMQSPLRGLMPTPSSSPVSKPGS